MELKQEAAWRMKWFCIALVSLVSAGTCLGQEAQPARPDIEILKLHWEKQVRLPRNFDPSVIPTGGTFNDPGSRVSSSSPGSATSSVGTAPAARTAGENSVTFPAAPGRLPIFYVYSLKIRNTGSKLIEGIAWDYLFIDADNNAELGKHQFLSYEKIPVNKSMTLKAQLRSPPVRVVRSAESARNTHSKLIEKSVIQCILYGDDTAWKDPHARDGMCELLKNNKALLKRRPG